MKRSIVLRLLGGGLLAVGLFCLLAVSPRVAWADPGVLFASPTGSGSACSQDAPCQLQTALSQAADGDTIYLAQGTYTGSGAAVITLTKSITLYGGWDGAANGPVMRDPQAYSTTIDGEGMRRGVYISGGVAPVLDGLIITGGNATGFGGYGSSDAGGGIFVSGADPLIQGCLVISNTAGENGTGGGLFFYSSSACIESCAVVSNTAPWGGGVRAIFGAPIFHASEFVSNTAGYGGGIYLMWTTAGTLVEANTFRENKGSSGGAIYLSGATATIRRNLIRDNEGGRGGGVSVASGCAPVVLSANRIQGNVAERGGGVHIYMNPTRLDNNFIVENQVSEGGAGVFIEKAAPTFRHNTLARNSGGDGSGILVGIDSAAVLTNTILVSHTVGISVTVGSTATLEATLWGSEAWANDSDWAGGGTLTTGTVNLWGDPVFVDPDIKDYHIAPGSVAVDAGVDAGVNVDIDGDPRPTGVGYDLGADELILPSIYLYLPLVLKGLP